LRKKKMRPPIHKWARRLSIRALSALAVLISAQAASAEPASASSVRLRIVGGLAGLNQYTRHEEPFWTRELPKLTAGRATAEIVPFDRAGIRGQEMLRLVALGAVPFGTALLSLSSSVDAEVAAPDLAGLSPDIDAMRRNTAAFRPYLQRMLSERYGIELLSLYIYPAQEIFCAKPLKGLADLAGRRVRISSPPQADLVEALGGTAVQTGFADIVPNMRSGNMECAITGTMSGNTIGLHEVTSYLHTVPITWGLAAFVANGAAWRALPADVQAVLRRELPKLEQEVWAESASETGEGVACNTGAAVCKSGRKGHMTEVPESPQDRRLLREIFAKTVLPRWVQRCGPQCADVWRQTIGPAAGIELR
jgi:TRAP-type C4-dicarboxylate transport system substrate-binding protein